MSSFTQYTSELSSYAEQSVFERIREGCNGERGLLPALCWPEIKSILPRRVDLISKKAQLLTGSEGWDQLGIDAFFIWEDRKFAVDITTGSSSVIKNKKKKMTELLPLLGEDYTLVVLTIRREFTCLEWEDFLIEAYEHGEEIVDYRWV